MNTAGLILCGILVVSLVIYVIFTFAKKNKIIQDISSILVIISIGILSGLSLTSYIPASYHILKLTILAFSFITLKQVLDIFENNRKVSIISGILFLITITVWIALYKSVFFIYRVPLWVNILAASSYFVLFLLMFLIFVKKHKFIFYLFSIISGIIMSFLHYSAFVYLCFNPVDYNIIKFIGITLLMGYTVFGMLTKSIINIKLQKFISFMILAAAFVLIPLSNIMVLN